MTDALAKFVPVDYVATKPSIKIPRDQAPGARRREYFQFRDGRLQLKTAEEVAEMDRVLASMSPAARAWVRKVDPNTAVAIAKKHQTELLKLKGTAIQGVQTAQSRAEQIHDVTTKLTESKAKHLGLAPQNPLAPLQGEVREDLGDRPNPSDALVNNPPQPDRPAMKLNIPGKKSE